MKNRKKALIDLVIAANPEDFGQREVALAAILCGDVSVDGEKCRDARRLFDADVSIAVRASRSRSAEGIPGLPFVSRAGYKLDSILESWNVRVEGRTWLDAGSSTGGFTHCLLLRNARFVHSVDVGYNLLDSRLRAIPRLGIHERCNIMGLKKSDLEPAADAAVADLSFRSMEKAARQILSLVSDNELYALVKPQFERRFAGDSLRAAGFSGVVGEGETRVILRDLAERLGVEGVEIRRIAPSPMRGRKGNQEYIAELGIDGDGEASERILKNQAVLETMEESSG